VCLKELGIVGKDKKRLAMLAEKAHKEVVEEV
jgi:hypothetical protein